MADRAEDLMVIVVFAPDEAADAVRAALADAGAGRIGAYRACSFSASGTGRFEPLDGARPAIGQVGAAETVPEQRIECVCPRAGARAALEAMIAAHPYEEPAYHAYPVLTLDDL